VNVVKWIAIGILVVLALISLYPYRFKKKEVLWIMLIPVASIPTFLTFFAARTTPSPHDLAFALSALSITLITTAARWALVWYMRWQKANTYRDNTIIRERKIQVFASLLALAGGLFFLTQLW